jgi:hypothetical protein
MGWNRQNYAELHDRFNGLEGFDKDFVSLSVLLPEVGDNPDISSSA